MQNESDASLKIRDCRVQDLDRIKEIEDLSFDDPYPLSLFLRFYEEYPQGFRVAEMNGKIVGYCILTRLKKRLFSKELVSLIASLAVHPDFRKRRIGHALLQDAISITRLLPNKKVIKLQVSISNSAARSLYSKFGFVEKKRLVHYYGWGKHAAEMELTLD